MIAAPYDLAPNAPITRREAAFSPCGRYRYSLVRSWKQSHEPTGLLVFVMLNPSTADGQVDDPTIRRCIGFGHRFVGVNTIEVVNLFAWRATNPADLLRWPDERTLVGDDNDMFIRNAIANALHVVVAWGAHPAARRGGRDRAVLELLRGRVGDVPPLCLGRSRGGAPLHPLLLPREAPVVPFEQEGGGA